MGWFEQVGNIHSSVDWEHGPAGHFVHESCRMTLCNATKLEQAKKRQKKRELEKFYSHDMASSVSGHCSQAVAPALGPIHDKTNVFGVVSRNQQSIQNQSST